MQQFGLVSGEESLLAAASMNVLPKGIESYDRELIGSTLLFMDCISPVLFLQDGFSERINAVYVGDIQMIGTLSIGEMANSGQDYLEYYNNTFVVCILGD